MALSNQLVWEVRSAVGSDTNGGAFLTGASGTDYSQQNSKNSGGNNSSTTDVVATGIATITSASASFTSAIVGNIIYLTGTGITTGWYQVVTFSNGTTVILDRSPGTGTGATMNIGGALQTLSQAVASMVANNVIYCKGSETRTTALSLTLNSASGTLAPNRITGYTSARGDGGRFTVQTSTNSCDGIDYASGADQWILQNLLIESTAGSPGYGISAGVAGASNNLTLDNVRITGFQEGIRGPFSTQYYIFPLTLNNCEVDHSVSHGIDVAAHVMILNSYVHDNGGNGLMTENAGQIYQAYCAINSVFYNNTGNGIDQAANFNGCIINCVLANNSIGYLFDASTAGSVTIINTIVDSNGTGFKGLGGFSGVFKNNATRANTTLFDGFPDLFEGTITLTADPFTNRSAGDFSLNSTAGGGAACKAAGFQSTLI